MHPSDSGAVVIDPGAPMEIGVEKPTPVTPTTAAKTPDQLENERLRAEVEEQRANAQYWANRARGGPAPVEEVEEHEEPIVNVPASTQETVDQFIDGLNKDGLDALKKRGFITADQLADALQKVEDRMVGGYRADQEARQFDVRLSQEFPELIEANKRVDAGKPANSELFTLTSKHFQDLAKDTPGLKLDSPMGRTLMIAAARMAKAEIGAKSVQQGESNQQRRERIDGQPGRGGARGGGADADLDAPAEIGETSRAIIANLRGFGVTEEKFKANVGAQFERRNGRGR